MSSFRSFLSIPVLKTTIIFWISQHFLFSGTMVTSKDELGFGLNLYGNFHSHPCSSSNCDQGRPHPTATHTQSSGDAWDIMDQNWPHGYWPNMTNNTDLTWPYGHIRSVRLWASPARCHTPERCSLRNVCSQASPKGNTTYLHSCFPGISHADHNPFTAPECSLNSGHPPPPGDTAHTDQP